MSETTITEKPAASMLPNEESSIKLAWHAFKMSMSLRGVVVISLVWTVCFMGLTAVNIPEALSTFTGLALGYYFGKTNGGK